LVLFLTGSPVEGALGWHRDEALQVYGIFAGLAFTFPAVGGWLGDRVIGHRAGALAGGVAILLGNLSLFALTWPFFAPVARALLFAGLGAIAVGTGLLKPAVATLVGRIYDGRPDLPRSTGYTVFLMGIYLGGLMGTLIAGALGEMLGFRWGFLTSALGMGTGLIIFATLAQQHLGEVGARPVRRPASERDSKRAMPGAITAISLMTLFSAVYTTAYMQKAGVLMLMVTSSTDRTIGNFTVPASAFLALSQVGFLIFAPIVEMCLAWLARRGFHLDLFIRQVCALLALAIGYVFFLTAASVSAHAPSGLHSAGWIVAGYLCFAIGEILIWPSLLSTISHLSPPRLTGLVMGLWYVGMGLGSYLAGFLGAYADNLGLVDYLGLVLSGLIAAAALLFVIRARSPALTAAVNPRAATA